MRFLSQAFRLSLFLVCVTSFSPALANPFAAAGRIEKVESAGACSAALIREDVVATAAHCVSDQSVEGRVFRVGDGKQTPPFEAKRIVIHPFYGTFEDQRLRRLRFDIALVQLERPVPAEIATPFVLAGEAEVGEGLFLASWRRGEGPRPRQRRCLVIEGEVEGVVTLGCMVRGGESGAPVLRLKDGSLELVAIINSQSRQGRQPVAFAADVRLRIPPLLDQLDRTP